MAVITPTTFDPLQRYVSVRLQQGVPIVDADWNEQDDLRRFELRAFLAWFVGDGVPAGFDDAFRVEPRPGDNAVAVLNGAPAAPAGAEHEIIALRHAGRALVDGLDVMIVDEVLFNEQTVAGQSLMAGRPGADALAHRLGVPTIAPLSTPAAEGPVLLYLDVWERLVKPADEPALVLSDLGVESCARVRREWVVRARDGRALPGAAERLPGHSYLPLAVLERRANRGPVDRVTDVRPRGLSLSPSRLVTDTLGVDPAEYRRGGGRPPVSLREAVNALLAGELPATSDLPVSPTARPDLIGRAFTVAGAQLVALWYAQVGAAPQVQLSAVDLNRAARGFPATATQVTSGASNQRPSVAALEDGDVVAVYQTGPPGSPGSDIVMRRGRPTALATAPETAVFATPGVGEQRPLAIAFPGVAVLIGYTAGAGGATGSWGYRRYLTATDAFDAAGRQLLENAAEPPGDGHAAASPGPGGGTVWFTFVDGSTLKVRSFQQADGGVDSSADFAGQQASNPFVVARSQDTATLFWQEDGATAGLYFADCAGNVWGPRTPVPGSGPNDREPAAALDPSGRTWLFSTQAQTGAAGTDIVVRTRHPQTGEWSPARRVVSARGNDSFPHPVHVAGEGIWLFWTSDRSGQLDILAKRIVIAL